MDLKIVPDWGKGVATYYRSSNFPANFNHERRTNTASRKYIFRQKGGGAEGANANDGERPATAPKRQNKAIQVDLPITAAITEAAQPSPASDPMFIQTQCRWVVNGIHDLLYIGRVI